MQSSIFRNAAFISLAVMWHCSPVLFYLPLLTRSSLLKLPQRYTASREASGSLTAQISQRYHFPEDPGNILLVFWDTVGAIHVTSEGKGNRKRGTILKGSKRRKGISMWLSIEGILLTKRMGGGCWSSSLKGLTAWCQGLTGRHTWLYPVMEDKKCVIMS